MQHFISYVLLFSNKIADHAELPTFFMNIKNCEWIKCFSNCSLQAIAMGNASSVDRKELLLTAIAALHAFIQDNFVGPRLPVTNAINIPPELKVNEFVKSDGEELNENVSSPELLYICKTAFDCLIEDSADQTTFGERLWYLRYLLIHQRCLDDLTHSLYSKFDQNVEYLAKCFESIDSWNLKLQAHIEIVQGYILFKRITKSERWMNLLQSFSGIEPVVEGVLGVRTKYQQNPLPQLALRIKGLEMLQLPTSTETHGYTNLPSILKLDDDLRLEKIKYIAEQENMDVQLPSLVQQIVLTKL